MLKSTGSIIVVIVLIIIATITTVTTLLTVHLSRKPTRSESQSASPSTSSSVVPSNDPSASTMMPTFELSVEAVFSITLAGTCTSTDEIVDALLSIIKSAVPSTLDDSGASFVIAKTESSCDSFERRQLMNTVAIGTITYIIVAQTKLGGDDLIEAVKGDLLGKDLSSGVFVDSIGLIIPSDAPSVQPSLSINPSTAPSDLPSVSLSPSAAPSDLPSVSLSPSAAPSELPSISLSPSAAPSELPSVSLSPSAAPSDVPSVSLGPSAAPSDLPTTYPSLFPSESHIPSTSLTPSQSPSMYPSESQSPSTSPSESKSPSYSPTTQPSIFPSLHIDTWKILGGDIFGESANDRFAQSVCLSKNGTVLAVGGMFNGGNGDYSGHVRVFKWSGKEWIQRGDDFYGEKAGNHLGFSVALSDDGSVVIMGARVNDDNGLNAGHVRVYEWSKDGSSAAEAWAQKGNTIKGEAAGEQSGYSVTMNEDGSVVGIGGLNQSGFLGHVRVFEFKNESWVQRGQGIYGEIRNDWSGHSISLDSSGSTISIGAPRNGGKYGNDYAGHVRVYDWNEYMWVQRGEDIHGESNSGDYSGWSVSLNGAGTVVAIGAPSASHRKGQARVYEWRGDEEDAGWIQRGASIIGEESIVSDNLGGSISVDRSGDIVAIGASRGGDNDRGIVYVYEWDGLTSTWNLKGEMQGELGRALFGSSVSISADASTIAVGAPDHGEPFDYIAAGPGVARVYKWY